MNTPSGLTNNDARISVLLLVTRGEMGGAQRYVYEIATRLARAGYKVTVACGCDGPLAELLERAGVTAVGVPHLTPRIHPIKDVRALLFFLHLIRSTGCQVVHANSSKAGLLGRIAARLARVPVVVFTTHGYVFNEPMGALKRWFYTQCERVGGRLCDMVISVCDVDRVGAIRLGIVPDHRITTVRNGIDTAAIAPRAALRQAQGRPERSRGAAPRPAHGQGGLDPDGHPVVGTVANLYRNKGVRYLLEAAARVKQACPEARFVIIGDGPERDSLEKMREDLGLSATVAFVGRREDVPRMLPLLDVFVLPSLKEGLPFALLEAMAAGCPVIASAVGGIPEVIAPGRTGIMVPPGDSEALAEAILLLLRDRELAEHIGGAARERALANFDIGQMVVSTETIYRTLLARKTNHRGDDQPALSLRRVGDESHADGGRQAYRYLKHPPR